MKKQIKHFYIHFPFCTSRCGYCSFYTEQFSLKNREKFAEVLAEEIAQTHNYYEFRPATIYFGGGTPSLMSPLQLRGLIDLFPERSETCEITLECNPITLTKTYIAEISQLGINRISLGIQSMQDSNLKYIGRKHTPAQVVEVVKNLRQKGFKNISGDLIYGIPHQTVAAVKQDIEEFLKLDLEHISIYCLSLEEDSLLFKDVKLLPEDEVVAESYQLICAELEKAGYCQYEISNFAKGNHHSHHNLAYWEGKDYLGLGAGAYGTLANMRYNNNDLLQWEQDIAGARLFPNQEDLTKRDMINEYIMLQLRLNSGLSPELLKQKYNFDIWETKKEIIREFIKAALLEEKEGKLCLTQKSRFISNYIISELMEEQ